MSNKTLIRLIPLLNKSQPISSYKIEHMYLHDLLLHSYTGAHVDRFIF